MKNWLRKKLRNFINNYDEPDMPEQAKLSVARESDSMHEDPVLNFRVFSAVGGKVVEFNHYDRKTDRRNSTTYIITNDQDFGERISKIATMESLKL